ncbi:MAG TPA: sigma-54 dependent transcriptional regulator [Nitrospinota bacterium]|nr:sigma-54 dependent transcriptional regulator [Nitrospinota bacterium]
MGERPILVIDDEAGMRAAIRETLIRVGYDVTTASNGFEAISKLKENNFHLVLTDMKMPRMNGLEVLRKVKKQIPHLPVIMITAYGTIDTAVEAMKEGAFDYIIKPFSTEKLESVVNKALLNIDQKSLPQRDFSQIKINQKKEIVTKNKKMLEILEIAEEISKSNSAVMIQGESGTGKELLACYIHKSSQRRDKPFIAINCAALPEGLLESELFGHEKGSFTGAIARKIGKFELANDGTILLDEISEMEHQLQAKLLRVLQEYEIDRVGGRTPIPIDIRIVSTTNKDLKEEVKKGNFREDLFYRLNVIPLTIPPLRERKGDISILADHFLKKYSKRNGKKTSRISEETIDLLKKYYWRGNVRELENVIERAVVLCDGDVILPKNLFMNEEFDNEESISVRAGVSLREMEKQLIFKTLDEVGGNRTHAAKVLGISIRTLRNKLNEYKENPLKQI